MTQSPDIGRIALVGPCDESSTFVSQLANALRTRRPATRIIPIGIAPTRPKSHASAAPSREIVADDRLSYTAAARFLNRSKLGVDAVSLHYDPALYGGTDGDFLLAFLESLTVPALLTVHHTSAHLSRHFATTLQRAVDLSDRVVIDREECHGALVDEMCLCPRKMAVIPLPNSPLAVRDFAARQMDDDDSLAAAPEGVREDEAWTWDNVAELYNQNLAKAIVDAAPAKRSQRMQPWPWVHMREFNVSSGSSPGWDG